MTPTPTDEFPLLHALALRGSLEELPGDASALVSASLVVRTPFGFTLTEAGHRRHRALSEQERESLDLGRLDIIYDRFLDLDAALRGLPSRWPTGDEDQRAALIGELGAIVERAEPVLRRSAEVAPRFLFYIERLREALDGLHAGDMDLVLESVRTVFMEIHEDYLQTLGRSYEQESA